MFNFGANKKLLRNDPDRAVCVWFCVQNWKKELEKHREKLMGGNESSSKKKEVKLFLCSIPYTVGLALDFPSLLRIQNIIK